MSTPKQEYLNRIRRNTAYPTYRGAIRIMVALGYLLAVVLILAALVGGIEPSPLGQLFDGPVLARVRLGGLLWGIFVFLGTRFFREAAFILVDIGDSIIDANSRISSQPDSEVIPPKVDKAQTTG